MWADWPRPKPDSENAPEPAIDVPQPGAEMQMPFSPPRLRSIVLLLAGIAVLAVAVVISTVL